MERNARGERPCPNSRTQWAFSRRVYARAIALPFVAFPLTDIDLVPRSRGFRHFRKGIIAHGGSGVVCLYTRVHTRLRESARSQTCRNNTVPEVADGWPTRLFEMEVSNSRVKWPLYWSWWSSYGHKLSPVWFNCYRKPTQQQRCITTTLKKI